MICWPSVNLRCLKASFWSLLLFIPLLFTSLVSAGAYNFLWAAFNFLWTSIVPFHCAKHHCSVLWCQSMDSSSIGFQKQFFKTHQRAEVCVISTGICPGPPNLPNTNQNSWHTMLFPEGHIHHYQCTKCLHCPSCANGRSPQSMCMSNATWSQPEGNCTGRWSERTSSRQDSKMCGIWQLSAK